MSEDYDVKKIEEKWRKYWDDNKYPIANVKDSPKAKFYNLCMFPYPSGAALHIGHAYTYSGVDAYGRFKRHMGYNVFQPMGFDAFGIHGENFAIKVNRHPSDVLEENVTKFRSQMDKLGTLFDWEHTVNTSYPDYYKWTQWIFVQLYKQGLVERKNAQVNWCPSCQTVLSDEQVIQGKCERCGTLTEKKEMLQWFFKITNYAQKLLDNLDELDWPHRVTILQKNWIGRSEGANITFDVVDENGKRVADEIIEVFTTRPDTLFGVTFVVVSTKHPILQRVEGEYSEKVDEFIKEVESQTAVENQKTKAGEFTGLYVINPINGEKVPVFVSSYVLVDYGTGALMGVPAHDSRDYDFAKKYGIAIRQVVESEENSELPFESEGKMINSGVYDGMDSSSVREKIVNDLSKQKKASFGIEYKLRDWLISRQRYWGPPIPIVYCDTCGTVLVEDLPVFLPNVEDFKPKNDGKSPLANVESFVNTTCPKCGGKARRETDVLDNFVDSSWYYLRYPSAGMNEVAFDKALTKHWLPVDIYIGGVEHAVLHLLYARFIAYALHDGGFVDFDEPFTKLRANGLIIKDGAKMSKSKGNVVNPDDYLETYGADVLRMYLLFIGPFSIGGDFSERNIVGIARFLERIWLSRNLKGSKTVTTADVSTIHELTNHITEEIDQLRFNTAIAGLMEYHNWMQKYHTQVAAKQFTQIMESFVIMLSVFAVFMSEEIWQEWGHKKSIILEEWPKLEMVKKDSVTIAVEINGKVRSTISISTQANEKDVTALALADTTIQRHLNGVKYKNVIFVKNKIINIIV